MKYLKLFENFESVEELEDYLIDLIDTGMLKRKPDGEYFDISLVRKTGGGKWIPTHYSVQFQLDSKPITTIKELENNKNLYEKIYQIIYRLGEEFRLSKNTLTILVKVGESVKNFFTIWSTGKDEIDIDSQPGDAHWSSRKIAPFTVQKIEKDFSIILARHSYNTKDYNEILDLVKSKVDSGSGYNAEVYGIENRHGDRITAFHEFYIKVKP